MRSRRLSEIAGLTHAKEGLTAQWLMMSLQLGSSIPTGVTACAKQLRSRFLTSAYDSTDIRDFSGCGSRWCVVGDELIRASRLDVASVRQVHKLGYRLRWARSSDNRRI